MQCEKFERRLHQVLDARGRPEDDPQLRRHAGDCPACQGMLVSQRALWSGLAQLSPPQPGDELAVAVVCEITNEARSSTHTSLAVSRRRAGRFPAWSIAAAALLILAPLAYWSYLLTTPTSAPATDVVQDNEVPPEAGPATDAPTDASPQNAIARKPVLPTDPSAAAREEQYAAMLDRWRTQLTETGGRLGLTGADAPTVQSAAAVSQLTDRLRSPLAASIESTLNVLRTALPSTNEEKSQAKPQAKLFELRENRLA